MISPGSSHKRCAALFSPGMVQVLPGASAFAVPCLSCNQEQAQSSGISTLGAFPLTGRCKRDGNVGISEIIRQLFWKVFQKKQLIHDAGNK